VGRVLDSNEHLAAADVGGRRVPVARVRRELEQVGFPRERDVHDDANPVDVERPAPADVSAGMAADVVLDLGWRILPPLFGMQLRRIDAVAFDERRDPLILVGLHQVSFGRLGDLFVHRPRVAFERVAEVSFVEQTPASHAPTLSEAPGVPGAERRRVGGSASSAPDAYIVASDGDAVGTSRRSSKSQRRSSHGPNVGTKRPRDTGLGASSERLSGFGLGPCPFLAFATAVRSLVQRCVWRIPLWPVHGFDELDVFVGHRLSDLVQVLDEAIPRVP
jgi:hypothetical protein